jgi:hypothetical protein
MSDPARAMAAANLLVSRAVEFNRALNQEKTVLLRDLLAAEQAEARKRMDAASDQYLAFQGSAQVDLTRRDVAAVLDQRSGLLGLTVQLQAERARLGKAEEELARHSRYVDAPGRASTTAALLDKAMAGESSATSNAPAPPGPQPLSSTSPATNVRLDQPSQGLPSGLDLSNPLLNPVYQVIDYEVAAGRSRVAGLERQRSELVDRLKLNAPQVKELGDLQQKETRLEELHLEFELARDVYANLSKRYEEARASLGSQSAGLQVIDPALPPAMPMAASAWQTAVVATASGLMLGTILVLVGYAISTRRRSAF